MAAQLKHTLMEEKRRWRIVTNGRNFIPQHRIDAILTNESLSKALLECELEPHELYQAKKSVLESGRKTFAILILIGAGEKIQSCLEHSLDYNLDVKLPLSYLDIRECLGDAADDFDLRQWELIAPVFDEEKGHRCLKEGTLLPYMSEVRCSGQGSFGTIYEVVIPTSHIKALSGVVQEKISLIRKDIGVSSLSSKSSPIEALNSEHLQVQSAVEADSVSSKDEDRDKNLRDFKAELKMLATLQSLRHPNILRLLGSYTLGNIHSFLFPRKQCSLEDVLQGRKEAKIFSNDVYTFQALSRLSSAVESLHNFTSTILQVELIGCHRDIKPDNILVDDENFYLADFGLSVFRKGQDGSSTSYNHGGGYYRAPECENPDARLAKGKINRASDIWSFGCILAEVLTYLVQGSPGVQTFQEERRIRLIGCFETHVFHKYNEDHPRVKKWLDQLPIDPESARARLRLLILQILSINPDERPTAQDVSLRLRTLCIQCQLEGLTQSLQSLCDLSGDLELKMEHERLSKIHASMKNTRNDSTLASLQQTLRIKLSTKSGVDEILESFDALEHEIARQNQGEFSLGQQGLRLLRLHLGNALDTILNGVPKGALEDLQSRIETKFLSTDDRETLEKYSDVFSESNETHVLGRLAAAKLMSMSLSSPMNEMSTELRFDASALSNPKMVDNIELAQYSGATVIVERKKIEAYWTDEFGKRLLQRVIRLAEELSKPPIPLFRTLQCVGFSCYPDSRLSFSLLFKFPTSEEHPSLCMCTLARALKNKAKKPLLEHRYLLALALARSIVQFHKADWLHKNITSSSVVFFRPSGEDCNGESCTTHGPIDFRYPFVVGFNYSRPGDENEWSEGCLSDNSLLRYQHPDYAHHGKTFRRSYDYYSLGMVLLEIGLWRDLKSLTKQLKEGTSPVEIMEAIVGDLIPELGMQMGSAYTTAVRFCLVDIQEHSEQDETLGAYHGHIDMFNDKVVRCLQLCASALGGDD